MSDEDFERETVSDVLKNESVRQAVILAFSVAGSVAMVWVMRSVSGPDSLRSLKMKGALAAKKFADSRVEWWQARAHHFATVYNRERY
jgi:hypothetical protein